MSRKRAGNLDIDYAAYAAQLLEGDLSELDRAELTLAAQLLESALAGARKSPKAATFAELSQARSLHDQTVARLWNARHPDDQIPTAASGETRDAAVTASQTQVREALREAGYRIAQGKLSQEWGDKIAITRDNRARLADVIRYAALLRLESGGDGLAEEKLREEINKLKLQTERMRLENRETDKNYVLRLEAERECAVLLALLRDDIAGAARRAVPQILLLAASAAGGENAVADCLDDAIRAAVNGFAAQRQQDVEITDETY